VSRIATAPADLDQDIARLAAYLARAGRWPLIHSLDHEEAEMARVRLAITNLFRAKTMPPAQQAACRAIPGWTWPHETHRTHLDGPTPAPQPANRTSNLNLSPDQGHQVTHTTDAATCIPDLVRVLPPSSAANFLFAAHFAAEADKAEALAEHYAAQADLERARAVELRARAHTTRCEGRLIDTPAPRKGAL